MSSPEHSNEDRHFVTVDDSTAVLAVMDGHDGDRGVAYALGKFRGMSSQVGYRDVAAMTAFLNEMFRNVERSFFDDLRDVLRERESLHAIIAPVS